MNPVALAFLVIVASACCVYTGYAHPAERRMRDDASALKSGEQVADNCIGDLSKTGEDPFLTCFQEINSIYPDSVDYTPKIIVTFCNNSCPTVLRTLFEAIKKDCGSSTTVSDSISEIILYNDTQYVL